MSPGVPLGSSSSVELNRSEAFFQTLSKKMQSLYGINITQYTLTPAGPDPDQKVQNHG